MAMIRTTGFVRLRRGLVQHVAEGSMAMADAWLYVAMLINADPKTGVWIGSAETLALLFSMNPRRCQRSLLRLENRHYIKRLVEPGKKGGFPILIDRYECSVGSLTGRRLNATESISVKNLIYFDVDEVSAEDETVNQEESISIEGQDSLGVGEVSPEVSAELSAEMSAEMSAKVSSYLYRDKRQETRDKTLAASPQRKPSATEGGSLRAKERRPSGTKAKDFSRTPNGSTPADERHGECKDVLGEYWASRNSSSMPWDGSEGRALSQLLAANPQLDADQLRELLRHRFASEVNHAERPRVWLGRVTDYAHGPLDRFKNQKQEQSGNGKHGPNHRGGAVGRVERTGDAWDRALAKRLGDSTGDDAAADVRCISAPGVRGGHDGSAPDGLRGSCDGVRGFTRGDGFTAVSEQEEIFPAPKRSSGGA